MALSISCHKGILNKQNTCVRISLKKIEMPFSCGDSNIEKGD